MLVIGKELFEEISFGVCFKYVRIQVVVKVLVKFRGSATEVADNRSKFPKNGILSNRQQSNNCWRH